MLGHTGESYTGQDRVSKLSPTHEQFEELAGNLESLALD
jgi:hypothetical protein